MAELGNIRLGFVFNFFLDNTRDQKGKGKLVKCSHHLFEGLRGLKILFISISFILSLFCRQLEGVISGLVSDSIVKLKLS